MKKILYLLFLLCLSFANLFAQPHTVDERVYIDDKVYPKCSNRDTYVPVLWEKTNLYYYISNSSSDLTFSQCQTAIQNAFFTWSQYSRFTFTQTSNLSQADIKLSWEVGSHGSNCPSFYDYPSVAHSTYGKLNNVTPPCFIHFNDDFTFSTDGTHYDVESVTLHEIGHCLGLDDNYTNSSAVMYYQIPSGTSGIRRSLTSYDYNALYSLYGFPTAIEGPNYICQHDTCYLNNLDKLPSNFTVTWSLSDSYYNTHNCLMSNIPTTGYCIITRDPNQDMTDATLTAKIKKGNTIIKELTKDHMHVYAGFKGNYTSGDLSGSIPYTYYFNIRTNATTYIKSANFYGATVTYSSSGATPSIWGFSSYNGDLTFVTTTPNSAVVINVTDTSGNSYVLYAYATSQYGLNVSNEGDYIIVTLDDEDNSQRSSGVDQSWTIEVRNVTTGQLMATQSSTSRSESISTVGWPKGIYVVKVTIGKEVLTEKVIVK